MFTFLKNKLKEKKGISSLQITIGALIVSFVFAFLCDLVHVSNRMQSISSAMSYVSKVVSNQGCLTNNPESAYVDSSGNRLYEIDYIKNKKYVDANNLYNAVLNIMNSDGIPTSDWKITIGGQTLSANMKTPLYDFRERIPITVEINYSWNTIANMLPINSSLLSGTFASSQEIVSNYKIRYANSDEGFIYG